MMSGTDIGNAILAQAQPTIDRLVDEKIQEIILTVQSRWQDRISRRVMEAQWAVKQGRIYDPNHALMKIYDAYRWVADHVELDVSIVKTQSGANITMTAKANDGTAIDDFRQERVGECIADLTSQINYSYF